MSQKIDYGNAAKNIIKTSFNDCTIDKEGKELASEIMQEIHSTLIRQFEHEYGTIKKQTDDAVLQSVQRAVQNALPADFRRFALAEAQRQLNLYENGLLKYDYANELEALRSSTELEKAERKGKKSEIPYASISSNLKKILSKIDPMVRIDNNAKNFIGYHLYKLAVEVANKASAESSDKIILENTDISEILPNILHRDLLDLAHNEGTRASILHLQGIQPFKPRKPSRSHIARLDAVDQPPSKKAKKEKDDAMDEYEDPSQGPLVVFKDGFRKTFKTFPVNHDEYKLDPSVIDSVGRILRDVANKVADDVADLSRNENNAEIGLETVNNITRETLPPLMYQHSLRQANFFVDNYNTGILKFRKIKPKSSEEVEKKTKPKASPAKKAKTPKKSRVRKSRSPKTKRGVKRTAKGEKKPRSKSPQKAKKTPKKKNDLMNENTQPKVPKSSKKEKLDFTDGIIKTAQKFSAHLGTTASNQINASLKDVCNKLIAYCTTNARDELSHENVRAAVEYIFPRQLAHHAFASANKDVIMYQKIKKIDKDSATLNPPGTEEVNTIDQRGASERASEPDQDEVNTRDQRGASDRVPEPEENREANPDSAETAALGEDPVK